MPKFTVIAWRILEQSQEVTVEADSLDTAILKVREEFPLSQWKDGDVHELQVFTQD